MFGSYRFCVIMFTSPFCAAVPALTTYGSERCQVAIPLVDIMAKHLEHYFKGSVCDIRSWRIFILMDLRLAFSTKIHILIIP